MSYVQSNRKVGFIGMKFSIQLTRYLQSFIKFVKKFVVLSEKRIRKTLSHERTQRLFTGSIIPRSDVFSAGS